MIGNAPICLQCKHLHENNFDGLTCDAFPVKIPDEIINRENDHTKPLPGQTNEIVYEPKEKIK